MATLDDILRRKFGNPPRAGSADDYAKLVLIDADGKPTGEPLPPEEEIRAFSAEVDQIMRQEEMVVSPMQLELELYARGLLDACEAIVAAAPAPVQIRWKRMVAVHRLNAFILQFGSILGLTDGQIDEIFEAAALIEG